MFTCTYRGTHTQAHMYNQHTRGMATSRHRSLFERGGRKALLETLHTQKNKMSGKIDIHDSGTGRVGVSMAGGREGQSARMGNGVRGHRLPSPPCFVQNLLMYFGFLSR